MQTVPDKRKSGTDIDALQWNMLMYNLLSAMKRGDRALQGAMTLTRAVPVWIHLTHPS